MFTSIHSSVILTPLSRLRAIVQRLMNQMVDLEAEALETLLWACFAGAVAAGGSEELREFYVTRLVVLTEMLGLRNWSDVKVRLQRQPWDEWMMDARYHETYDLARSLHVQSNVAAGVVSRPRAARTESHFNQGMTRMSPDLRVC